jgi:hypothetical protein
MGIDSTADKTPLLNNAEQNIGNSTILPPQPGGVNSGTIIPQPKSSRILNLQGGSAAGQTMSIVLTATRIVGADNPSPGLPGPITGIVDFGNGGRATSVECDVPVGPFVGSISQASPAVQPQDGGAIITVPTGVLRVYFRYDNRLIAPVIGASQSLAQIRGVLFVGPGGPLPSGGPAPPTPAEPVLVQAMAAYFSRHFSRAYKTVYCYCSNPVGPVPITIGNPAGIPPAFDFFCLPAFAQSVKVLRLPLTAALEICLHNNIRVVDTISVAAGAACPTIPVCGGENIIGIRSTTAGAGDQVNFLALSCEVGV